MDDYDESRDLFWHALNYRSARSGDEVERAWKELQACVQRLIDDKAKELEKA